MRNAEGYDVLRLIEHGQNCYVSSEYVRGTPLIRWLKYHPNISKEQLFLWMGEMARQLGCVHKCRGEPCYRYVNPYSMIITQEKELYFLDMNAKSNEKILILMQRRNIREYFLPPEEAYYQNESVSLDIYGLGKTFQYLLAMSEPEPSLNRREEARFQKIILRSTALTSRKPYSDMSELQKQISVYKPRDLHFVKRKKWIVTALILLLSVISLTMVVRLYQSGRSVAVNAGESPEENQEKVYTEKEINDLKKELGFLYFLEQKDYGKSRKYFSEVRNEKEAEYMAELAGYMSRSDLLGKEGMIRELLEKMTKEVTPDRKETEYYRCLIEGYRLLEGKDAAEEVIRLGELCMETAGAKVQQELRGAMAYAWEVLEESVKAIELYEEMLEQEDDIGVREALYKKLVVLWKEEGDLSEAANVCREGIEELEESVELRMVHIEMQCADTSIEREVCARTIQKYREEIPEIIENQEFKKLAKEYDIQMEGESVWVGR